MIPALRWAAMRAILMFHNCEGQSHKTVSTDHTFWRERRAETVSNRGPSAYQSNALPLGKTGSQSSWTYRSIYIYIYRSMLSLRVLTKPQWIRLQHPCIYTTFITFISPALYLLTWNSGRLTPGTRLQQPPEQRRPILPVSVLFLAFTDRGMMQRGLPINHVSLENFPIH